MTQPLDQELSRRERQIMAVLFQRGEASVGDLAETLPNAPTETAIRTLLRILEAKGHVTRYKSGRQHIYKPLVSKSKAARGALSQVLKTFFDGSLGDAVAAHLADPAAEIEPRELERLTRLVREAKKGSSR